MNYVWELENINLDKYDFEVMQDIICKKIAIMIIHSEKNNCTL